MLFLCLISFQYIWRFGQSVKENQVCQAELMDLRKELRFCFALFVICFYNFHFDG